MDGITYTSTPVLLSLKLVHPIIDADIEGVVVGAFGAHPCAIISLRQAGVYHARISIKKKIPL